MAEIIHSGRKKLLHIDGFLYYEHYTRKGTSYWQCRQKNECSARSITRYGQDQTLIVRKGPNESQHSHAPNREEVSAYRAMSGIKRRAAEHLEAPPAQILRSLNEVPHSVIAEMPNRENVRKLIQRERLREMPTNPINIEDLEEIPHMFRHTKRNQPFLLYDSFEDENYDQTRGRIIIYGTKENLALLFRSRTWYVDGTFKAVPAIFFQLFAIMGSITQKKGGVDEIVAIPLIYALLENKETSTYDQVFEIIMAKAAYFGVQIVIPQVIMTDFELAIINSVRNKIGDVVKACFFHLRQSVYRRVQAAGLQTQYNSEEDRSIKLACQQMCAIAFVPVDEVEAAFDLLDFPDEFGPIFLTKRNK